MNHLTRREFIHKGATALALTSAFTPSWLHANELPSAIQGSIGFQSWIVREQISKDFPGTLKKMAGLGYQSVEMCSPPGYLNSGFGSLQNLKAIEMKRIINDEGLTCESCHYGFDELKKDGEDRMNFAAELGLTQMVLSSFGLPKNASLSDWKRAADELNKLGEVAKSEGLQMVYHNHNMEFETLEGQLIYDVLLKQLDSDLIKMQFQVWVVIAGYTAANYFRKYPGRFISAHLSDWTGKGVEYATLGQGKVDWKDFFEASKIGGLKNFFVEMEGMDHLQESVLYLKKLS